AFRGSSRADDTPPLRTTPARLAAGGRYRDSSSHARPAPAARSKMPVSIPRWSFRMQARDVAQLIEGALPGARALVESDDGVHFTAAVVAPQFEGKNARERHRLVYSA